MKQTTINHRRNAPIILFVVLLCAAVLITVGSTLASLASVASLARRPLSFGVTRSAILKNKVSRRRASTLSPVHYAAPSSRAYIAPMCGDRIVTGMETCDDGNQMAGDGCSIACLIELGFFCDNAQPTRCWTLCGDGIKANVERCDDKNDTSGDGCDAQCKIEFPYVCTGTAPSACALPTYCGNGIVEAGETCDDGNQVAGDGCMSCKAE